jgi:hypothetical protein
MSEETGACAARWSTEYARFIGCPGFTFVLRGGEPLLGGDPKPATGLQSLQRRGASGFRHRVLMGKRSVLRSPRLAAGCSPTPVCLPRNGPRQILAFYRRS